MIKAVSDSEQIRLPCESYFGAAWQTYVWLLETAREMEALLTDMTEEKIALLAR